MGSIKQKKKRDEKKDTGKASTSKRPTEKEADKASSSSKLKEDNLLYEQQTKKPVQKNKTWRMELRMTDPTEPDILVLQIRDTFHFCQTENVL